MLSIKSECFDQMIFFNEESLRRAIREYVAHYHAERNHQGLANALIEPAAIETGSGPVRCRERLGGMLRYYHRDAGAADLRTLPRSQGQGVTSARNRQVTVERARSVPAESVP